MTFEEQFPSLEDAIQEITCGEMRWPSVVSCFAIEKNCLDKQKTIEQFRLFFDQAKQPKDLYQGDYVILKITGPAYANFMALLEAGWVPPKEEDENDE